MKNYSLIIPTLWKSDLIELMLEDYLKSKYIDEIIIIDNDPNGSKISKNKNIKIKVLKQSKNIYVNKAWNLGVYNSKNDYVIISNDDVYIKNIDSLIIESLKFDYSIVGMDIINTNKSKELQIRKLEDKDPMTKGYGCFLMMKKEKYINIPESMKIWYGDNIQFYNNKERYIFSVPSAKFYISKTIKSDPHFLSVISEDKINYQEYIKKNKRNM